ncbi:suppressor of fused domain protein [Streptomyces sp. NBC_01186]|uniref:suppressor of fused domain protein n=1 Tax=Streptomyces sp. NBC_01186 TaxID=2903765 RepID=UPI002E0EF050|nr:suppressor of fused domain protein [Streptomyces sp. NBC_01186]
MPAPAVLRDVFQALRKEWGEEDEGYTFENGPPPVDRLDVMVHRAQEHTATTAFATIGMAAHPMPAPGGPAVDGPASVPTPEERAELRLFRRGPLPPADEGRLATRLANLAAYPWTRGHPLGWGELVGFDDELPAFPGCRTLFLAGPWLTGQPATVETGVGPVRVLNAVPVSDEERQRARETRPETFFSDLLDTRDILAPPPVTRP